MARRVHDPTGTAGERLAPLPNRPQCCAGPAGVGHQLKPAPVANELSLPDTPADSDTLTLGATRR